MENPSFIIPAEAGIQRTKEPRSVNWVPAFGDDEGLIG